MSREIKFRAWDSECEHMLSWKDLTSLHDDGVTLIQEVHRKECDYLKLDQYTGLKDAKGVEIYEGDIVGFGDDSPSCKIGMYGELGYVFYCNNQGRFMVKLNKSNRELQLADHLLFSDMRACRFVYGNIHQNPELLGE